MLAIKSMAAIRRSQKQMTLLSQSLYWKRTSTSVLMKLLPQLACLMELKEEALIRA
jgi:hypothetical protein